MKREILFYRRAYEDQSQNALWRYMIEYFVSRYTHLAKEKLGVDALLTTTEPGGSPALYEFTDPILLYVHYGMNYLYSFKYIKKTLNCQGAQRKRDILFSGCLFFDTI